MENNHKPIAIVGMACRFPDADHEDQYWRLLKNGGNAVREVPADRWNSEHYYSEDVKAPNKLNTKWLGAVNNVGAFDNSFFCISPREAKSMDPQQRILLETSWHCIENAGVPLSRLQERITSVYMGIITTDYRQHLNSAGMEADGYMALGTFESVVANRISYHLNLSGVSLSINAACAASLVAIHEAKRSLQSGESSYALAGGVNLALDPWRGQVYSKSRMYSPDGKCRAFSADANGFVPGEGVGVLLLQRLEDALAENNHIYGIVQGSSVNHVGKSTSLTAPSVGAQRQLIINAYKDAKINPETVSYVEAHGTGTSLGDPIEVEALTQAFREQTEKRQYCDIGSVKTNIGHLESAAGVAGMIKILLMMKHRQIPPLLHADTLNPLIDFESSPFRVSKELKEWESIGEGIPLRAGVSSFGFSGVNCHVVLEEYCKAPDEAEMQAGSRAEFEVEGRKHVFLLSARSEESLGAQFEAWRQFSARDTFQSMSLKDISGVLLTGRERFDCRAGTTIASHEELVAFLHQPLLECKKGQHLDWHLHIGQLILKNIGDIQAVIDENEGYRHQLEKLLRVNGIKNFYHTKWSPSQAKVFSFIAVYAFVLTLQELGFLPSEFSGSGEGGWVALACSGIVEVKEILNRLSRSKSGTQMQLSRPKTPFYDSIHQRTILPYHFNGKYINFLLSQLLQKKTDYLNSLPLYLNKAKQLMNNQYTFKKQMEDWGEMIKQETGLNLFEAALNQSNQATEIGLETNEQRLLLLIAINSSINHLNLKWNLQENRLFKHESYDEMLQLLTDGLLKKREIIPLLINPSSENVQHTAELLNERQRQMNTENAYAIIKRRNRRLIEIKEAESWIDAVVSQPAASFLASGKRCLQLGGLEDGVDAAAEVGLEAGVGGRVRVETEKGAPSDLGQFIRLQQPLNLQETLLQLWLEGADIAWEKLVKEEGFHKTALPPYSFIRQFLWAKAPQIQEERLAAARQLPEKQDPGEQDANCMYYEPLWCKTRKAESSSRSVLFNETVLVFTKDPVLLQALKEDERQDQMTWIQVQGGEQFARMNEEAYSIRLSESADYGQLMKQLESEGRLPSKIIYDLPAGGFSGQKDEASIQEQLNKGIYALLHLTKAWMARKPRTTARLLHLSRLEEEQAESNPIEAALGAFFKTIHLENSRFHFKSIQLPVPLSMKAKCEVIWNELSISEDTAIQIRYEGMERYVKRFVPVSPEEFQQTNWRTASKGAYLITGGLGGLGMLFAKHLAKRNETVALVLIGRSSLTEEGRTVLREIEELGASVSYIQADVSRESDVAALVKQATEQFGAIRGVLHSAGIYRSRFILQKTQQEMDEVLTPKIKGTYLLDTYTMDEPLDFFVLFSSIAGVVGDVGLADYAYGNSFLDHFSSYREAQCKKGLRSGRTLAISWPIWADAGIQVGAAAQEQFLKQTGTRLLIAQAGLDFFDRLMSQHKRSHCLVSVGDEQQMRLFLESRFALGKWSLIQTGINSPSLVNERVVREQIERFLKELLADQLDVEPYQVEASVTFEAYGVDSILIHQLNAKLEQALGSVSKTLFFEYRTLGELTDYFVQHDSERITALFTSGDSGRSGSSNFSDSGHKSEYASDTGSVEELVQLDGSENDRYSIDSASPFEPSSATYEQDIAIIGISGRYPMADNIQEYWENLMNGRDCITEIPLERWDYRKYYDPNPESAEQGKMYCKWGGFISGADQFDPLFFQLSPREAESMDPQERLFLQTAWSALEDGGYTPSLLRTSNASSDERDIGVFVGVTTNSYQLLGLEAWRQGSSVPHSLPWSIANRVSYLLNLKGPSMPVDTACSSSLSAIHLACESLRKGECSSAIAGGVNLLLHPMEYAFRCQKRMLSPTGKCHSFGDGGDGYVPGEGVGAVLLKPLSAAIRDGDYIYAVVKGSAVNHGGRTNGYTVPDPKAQAKVIQQALKAASIDPRTISYIEAHGTGTSLGDPIEINGLVQGLEDKGGGRCSIGSVKSNIGHLEAAAGISGLTKIIMQLKYKKLVPSLHSATINSNIELEKTSFYIQQEFEDWHQLEMEWEGRRQWVPRRAGISSFGAGGANAHIIIEEYDREAETAAPDHEDSPQLIVLSARSEESLKQYAELLCRFLTLGQQSDHSAAQHARMDEQHKSVQFEQQVRGLIGELIDLEEKQCDGTDLHEYLTSHVQWKRFSHAINEAFHLETTPITISQYRDVQELVQDLYAEVRAAQAVGDAALGTVKIMEKTEGIVPDLSYASATDNVEIPSLQCIAYTLQIGRQAMGHRLSAVVSSREELKSKLKAYIAGASSVPDLYTGGPNQTAPKLYSLAEERSDDESIQLLMEGQELRKLAQIWVLGAAINWTQLYSGELPQRCPLPTYPFVRQHYWLAEDKQTAADRASSELGRTKVDKLHPLLDRNVSSFYEQKYCTRLNPEAFYVADHIVGVSRVLPGAATLEMARAAAELAGGNAVYKLTNVIWLHPITVEETGEGQDIYISLLGHEGGAEYRIASNRADGREATLYTEGEIEYTADEKEDARWLDLNELRERCTEWLNPLEIYNQYAARGLHYGKSFQAVTKLAWGNGEVLSDLVLPDSLIGEMEEYKLHPSLIDGALQSFIGLMKQDDHEMHTYLPFAMGAMKRLYPLPKICHAYVRLRKGSGNSETVSIDIHITDIDGRILLEITEFVMKKVRRKEQKQEQELLRLFQQLESGELDIEDIEARVGGIG